VLRQTERTAIYDAAALDLAARGLAYPCVCTRKEIESAASAPHGPEGPSYPGTCRGRFADLAAAESAAGGPAALRMRSSAGPIQFEDGLFGAQSFDLAEHGGDFPILRKTGAAAYQLATVLDDAESGVDLVIRGADLLSSTARQIVLQEALGLPRPAYLHLPLVVGPDGRRLAKRHGDTRLRTLRAAGVPAERVVGWIAGTCGLAEHGRNLRADALLERYDPQTLSPAAITLDRAEFHP
jgi:glutamyl-tRNA synthetase